jgi:hypothetical protein
VSGLLDTAAALRVPILVLPKRLCALRERLSQLGKCAVPYLRDAALGEVESPTHPSQRQALVEEIEGDHLPFLLSQGLNRLDEARPQLGTLCGRRPVCGPAFGYEPMRAAVTFEVGFERPNLNMPATLQVPQYSASPTPSCRATSPSVDARPRRCASSPLAGSTSRTRRLTRRLTGSVLRSSSRMDHRIFEIAYDSNLVWRSGSWVSIASGSPMMP